MNNKSVNLTLLDSNSTSFPKKYVFLPNKVFIVKVFVSTLMAAFAFYAFTANTLILYFKRRQRRKVQRRERPFDRYPVISTYIQSLAWSDVLCAIIAIPISIMTNFWDVVTNSDMVCKTIRYFNGLFSMVTMCNIFIMGIERYLSVFHPFVVPSKRTVKGLLLGAWITGGLMAFVLSSIFTVQKRIIGDESYTKVCVYDRNVPLYKVVFITSAIVVYIIPSIILIIISLRILVFLRRRKAALPTAGKNIPRFYGTSTLVTLICSFVVPFLFYLTFVSLNIIFKPSLNTITEFIVNRMGVLLAFSNSAVSPTVIIYSLQDLRRDLMELVRNTSSFLRKGIHPDPDTVMENSQNANASDYNNLSGPSVIEMKAIPLSIVPQSDSSHQALARLNVPRRIGVIEPLESSQSLNLKQIFSHDNPECV